MGDTAHIRHSDRGPIRLARVVGATLAAVALLAGCAGFGGAGSGTGGGSGSGAGDDYQLVTGGQFTFALSGQLKPFSFYEDSQLTGFDYDIGMEVAKRLGLEGKAVTGAFNTLLAGLQAGRFDAIVGSMTNTDERAKVADFSENYYESGAHLWVAADSPVQAVEDLEGATVGVPLGTTFEQWAREQPNIAEVRTYEGDIDALNDIPTGRLDGSITDKLVGAYMVKATGIDVHPLEPALFENSAAIPVRKDHEELLTAINDALQAMKDDGTYTKLSEKWFGLDLLAEEQQ